MDSDYALADLTDDDLPAVITLCRAALDLPEDVAEAAEIVLRLRETGPGRRLTGFVATDATGRPVGVVLGSLSPRDPATGHLDLVAVHPDDRRRGLGRTLVRRAEQALAALGARTVLLAGSAPYYAWPGIDVRYTAALCAATAWGYDRDDTGWNMTVQLAELTPPDAEQRRLAAAGITVRRARPDDVPALTGFARTHFNEGWAGEINDSVGRDRAGCHLATGADGAILGFAAWGSSRPSWFGPMGTAPAARGTGIGRVLLRRCLLDQRACGLDAADIGWVGPVPFYADAVGARVRRVFELYRRSLTGSQPDGT